MPSTIDMAKPENWVHANQNILKACRVAHMEPEPPQDAPDDFDIEELKKQIEAADPYEPRLKPIIADQEIAVAENGKQKPWTVKLMGDKSEYQDPAKPTKKLNYGVVVVRSLLWPGSYSFYHMGRHLNVYVGNGHKYETQAYYPLHPPKI